MDADENHFEKTRGDVKGWFSGYDLDKVPSRNKGKTVAQTLADRTDYADNSDKTNKGELVTGYGCDPRSADEEFLLSKSEYARLTGRDNGAKNVLAYHIRQSFKPGEVTPEEANEIGRELAIRFFKNKHAFIVATHIDKAHVHNHIIVNSTSLDCTKKFRNFKGSSFAIRRIADHLCIENGLSIVTNPKLSKGTIYAKQQGDDRAPTGRDRLWELIDENIIIGNSLTDFITKLKRAGVEIKHGKQFSFRPMESKRFFRQDSLGEDYSHEAILERLMGKRTVAPKKFVAFKITGQTKFSLLVDIQQKIQEGKGEAYENWARIYNLKQAARTLIYLQESGIDSYDELCKKASAASSDFNGRLTRIKEIETRQKEIAELQKQIGAYGKTREIYVQYKASGWDKNFYNTFAGDIILHKTAKKYFNELGLKKLPSINTLKQEWATLEAERKKLYHGYHELKDRRMDLLMARDNVERFLGINRDAPEYVADREQKRHKSHAL